MSKAEKLIKDCTRNCSNEIIVPTQDGNSYTKGYTHWLTPDQARKAVEIAMEETLQEVKEKLLIMLNPSIDNKPFFEQLDEYIDELENKQ